MAAKRIAVTGSIAQDHLMSFPGSFTDQLVGDLSSISLSFLVDDLEIRRGGTAANICVGMGQLGVEPVLVGAVGQDFLGDDEAWLQRHGVDTSGVWVSKDAHTARFLCTTDEHENQLASFYPGAMSEARRIELAPIVERVGSVDWVLVAANDPEAMARHTDQARHLGIPFIADPSQQLPRMDGPATRQLIDGADILIANEYERALTEDKSGWSADEIADRVRIRVTTHGPKGVTIEVRDHATIELPAVPPRPGVKVEPTGAGDAWRAGFLSGLCVDLPLEASAQLGCVVATQCLETVGPQEYRVGLDAAMDRLEGAYGREAAERIRSALSAGE
ncbi:MAG: carbohydrate kinase family protein [Nitriliruptorales bacterium]|nr:carbohydrate kinase family protein [Nitriliruptorales bacterium]